MKSPRPQKASQTLRILVIEDNQDVSDNICDFLGDKGHYVDFALDGITGLHLAVTNSYDVIILDILLPGIDGMTLCRRYCEDAVDPVPILMLTAKDTLEDKLEGFDAGADDYLLKPFALAELEARLHALARRAKKETSKVLESGAVRVDIGKRSVTHHGRDVQLNRTCFQILVELMRRSPDVVTREELESLLWGDFIPTSDVLRSHIYTLRKALDGVGVGTESAIETVVGVGFRLHSTVK